MKRLRSSLPSLLAILAATSVSAQTTTETGVDEDVIYLNPFVVNSSEDLGYRATNQISGTRVNMAIRDTPMSIEVLTSDQLRDTGATSFKESLAYSAGIFTDTQISAGSGVGPAVSGDSSPSSASRVGDRKTNAIIIRGFNAPFQQRFGFRVGAQMGVRGAPSGPGSRGSSGVTLGSLIDNVNVDRMEVVRGPAALLYGLGVVSGIVNIMPNQPLSEQRTELSVGIGTDQFRRFAFDNTGPLLRKDDGSPLLDYRVMLAFERKGDWTDYYLEDREYGAFQLKWYPLQNLSVFAELQSGTTRFEGHGGQFYRDGGGGSDPSWQDPYRRGFRNEYGEFYIWGKEDFAGSDPRIWDPNARDQLGNGFGSEFTQEMIDALGPLDGPFLPHSARISGPDTWYERKEWTGLIRADWGIMENLDFTIGAFYAAQDVEEFMVHPTLVSNGTIDGVELTTQGLNALGKYQEGSPEWDRTYRYRYVLEDLNLYRVPIPGTRPDQPMQMHERAVYYYWSKRPEEAVTAQVMMDLRYKFETPFLFGDTATHQILVGRQETSDTATVHRGGGIGDSVRLAREHNWPLGRDVVQVRGLDDLEPIRYQGEGLVRTGGSYSIIDVKNWYQGLYGVYTGTFFEDRLTVIGGLRRDRFQGYDEFWRRDPDSYGYPETKIGVQPGSGHLFDKALTVTTSSLGLNFRLNDAVSPYIVYSEGVIPTIGMVDGNGDAFDPERTTSKEIGFKFDLLDGRISGTLAFFQIDKENALWNYPGAPNPYLWASGQSEDSVKFKLDPEKVAGGLPRSYGVSGTLLLRDRLTQGLDPDQNPFRVYNPETAGLWEKLGYKWVDGPGVRVPQWSLPSEPKIKVVQPGLYINRDTGVQYEADTMRRDANFQDIIVRPAQYVLENKPSEYVVTIDRPGLITASPDELSKDFKPYVYFDYETAKNDPEIWAIMQEALDMAIKGTHPADIDPLRYDGGDAVVNASQGTGAFVTFEERTRGVDGQFIFTPLAKDNFQIIFTFAHIKREATSNFNMVQASDWRIQDEDSLAVTGFGTEFDRWVQDFGREAFVDPANPDATPDPTKMYGGVKGKSLYYGSENTASLWGRYTFREGPLKGFGIGLGARYVGSANTSVPIGRDILETRYPTPKVEAYYIFDGALYYTRSFEAFDFRIALNLYNLTDKHRLYSEATYENLDFPGVYETRRTERYINPFSARLTASFTF